MIRSGTLLLRDYTAKAARPCNIVYLKLGSPVAVGLAAYYIELDLLMPFYTCHTCAFRLQLLHVCCTASLRVTGAEIG